MRNLINSTETIVCAGIVLTAACMPTTLLAKKANTPNIILIMSDQQTASAMSCVGNPYVKTPALDALAKDGVLLNRAYCPFPLSGPSRASIITGRMPCEIGAPDNNIPIDEAEMMDNIGFKLLNNGYNTLYAGKWHVHEENIPDDRGFTYVCDSDDTIIVDEISKHLSKDQRDKPIFLVASFLNPHEICEFARRQSLPYGEVDTSDRDAYPNLPANFMPTTYEPEAIRLHQKFNPATHDTSLYTLDDWREYLYAYYRLVERVDYEIGRLIELLKEEGLYDNSLIIFCSDHGDGAAAHGWNQKWVLYEESIKVPFIIKAPNGEGVKGVQNSTALSNIGLDIVPTICDYANVELDESYNGKSLRDVVEGKSETLHDEVFVETLLRVNKIVRGWAIIEGKYKYTQYFQYQNREQLYDLEVDPGEMTNLAVDKRYEAELNRLRQKMYDWAIKVNDTKLIRSLKPHLAEKHYKD